MPFLTYRYTTPGSYNFNVPLNAISVAVIVVGAGGGGSSGSLSGVTEAAYAGCGGGSGDRKTASYDPEDLTSPVAIVVGTGGPGGASTVGASTPVPVISSRLPGTAGGLSSFGALSAVGGDPGTGGGAGAVGTNGSAGGNTGPTPDGGTSPTDNASGGGGGGAMNSDFVAHHDAGSGGAGESTTPSAGSALGGPPGGTTLPSGHGYAGGAGASDLPNGIGGGGGGGGSGQGNANPNDTGGHGGAGGAGGIGGGGGGGGPAFYRFFGAATSGAGGRGGHGYVQIIVEVPFIVWPDVVGMSLEDATAAFEAAGFVLGDVSYEIVEGAPVGLVASQSPTAGTLGGPGDEGDIVIAFAESYINTSTFNDEKVWPLQLGSRLHLREILCAAEPGTTRRPASNKPIKPGNSRVN